MNGIRISEFIIFVTRIELKICMQFIAESEYRKQITVSWIFIMLPYPTVERINVEHRILYPALIYNLRSTYSVSLK